MSILKCKRRVAVEESCVVKVYRGTLVVVMTATAVPIVSRLETIVKNKILIKKIGNNYLCIYNTRNETFVYLKQLVSYT